MELGLKLWMGCAIAGVLGVWVGYAGCVAKTPPVNVGQSMAPATMERFAIQGTVVDEAGRELSAVMQEFALFNTLGAKEGANVRPANIKPIADRQFAAGGTGTSCVLTLTKEGYLPVEYRMSSRQKGVIEVWQGGLRGEWAVTGWPQAEGLVAVMQKSGEARDDVRKYADTIRYGDYPRAKAILLPALAKGEPLATFLKRVDVEREIPAGVLCLTMVRGETETVDVKGVMETRDIGVPEEVVLRIGGDGGFVKIEPVKGTLPLIVSDEAPEEGYAPGLRLDRKRLTEMRESGPEQVAAGNAYFYFRWKEADGWRYGKGRFWWSTEGLESRRGVVGLDFRYEIYVGKRVGERGLRVR